ncbi:WxcM-like, C-terminal [Klenkia marina]|uniref:WxcM-like, C-terminal n=1 Tax=Klenkia marina TaxID=1960309 RepID=A0A1G4XAP8_9ACTN|nr:FdtA/QdtA family cupin domain-containing protein [Klenkia marina]SCX38300.1 WxcM-like, C-terminal [Klenkia marina]
MTLLDRRASTPGRRVADWNPEQSGSGAGCRLVPLPRITDPRGNLTAIEGGDHVPFDVARVYWLYDVPGGESRGGHAHRELQQLIVAVAGSFDVVVDDGTETARFHLNRSYVGLYVPRMTWRELGNFSSGSVCLVLASLHYAEDDYHREHEAFLRHRRAEDAAAASPRPGAA